MPRAWVHPAPRASPAGSVLSALQSGIASQTGAPLSRVIVIASGPAPGRRSAVRRHLLQWRSLPLSAIDAEGAALSGGLLPRRSSGSPPERATLRLRSGGRALRQMAAAAPVLLNYSVGGFGAGSAGLAAVALATNQVRALKRFSPGSPSSK